jgi:amidophosphoribosyltransferase
VTHPCFYGIDTPSRRELIGALKTVEEISQYLGVDSLGYISLEGMLSVEREPRRFCRACFTGDYPVPIDPTASKLSLEQLPRGAAIPGDAGRTRSGGSPARGVGRLAER